MQKLIIGAALALSLTFAATASAGSFDTFHDRERRRSVRLEGHWSVRPGSRETSMATRSSGSRTPSPPAAIADMPYSAHGSRPAGEQADNNVLTNEFTFKAVTADRSRVLP